jgi:hypothetical protein
VIATKNGDPAKTGIIKKPFSAWDKNKAIESNLQHRHLSNPLPVLFSALFICDCKFAINNWSDLC